MDGRADPKTDQNSPAEQSIVGKLRTHVSGIISNTPLSKWFRKREEDAAEEEELQQPPTKRIRRPEEYDNFESSLNGVRCAFPEPVAGPSGLRQLKLAQGAGGQGGKDSDSEESTSGYSSVARIGSKEQVCSVESSKQASPLENSPNKTSNILYRDIPSNSRSLFTERSLTPTNISMSSRRPSFNATSFGSPNFIDRTLSTQKIINSPFYTGRTIYGGASAYGKTLGRNANDLRQNLRKTVKIKPVNLNETKCGSQLSKTARRILDTLEQYSTPVQDAKKVPLPSKRLRLESGSSKYIGVNPYLVKSASNRELSVPSVTDLLKMKHEQQKSRLQESTEAVKHIASISKSTLNEQTYKITTTEKEQNKHTTKMRTKVSQVRQKTITEDIIQPIPILNANIPLPIKSLPKFDIKTSENIPQRPLIVDPPFKVSENKKETPEFKFSEPKILGENVRSIVAINDFKFSEPLCKKINDIVKNNGENLFDKFKPPENTWECSVCLIRNKSDVSKCVACETLRKKEKSEVKGFGDKFKVSSDMWECGTCMIRNKNELNKCAACETLRVVEKVDKKVDNSILDTFGSKFKPPSDTWECDTCLVRNTNDKTKCIACETPKNNKNEVKNDIKLPKSNDYWECPVCMVKNKSDMLKCQCCEEVKPGSSNTNSILKSTEKSSLTFNFGIDKSLASSFTFGIPQNEQNKSSTSNTNASTIFGATAQKSEAPTNVSFTFGVPSQNKTDENAKKIPKSPEIEPKKPNPLLKPTEKLPEKALPAASGFTFEVPTEKIKKPELVSSSTESSKVDSTAKAPSVNGDFNKANFNFKPPSDMFLFAPKNKTQKVDDKGATSVNVAAPFGAVATTSSNAKSEVKTFGFTAASEAPPNKAPMFSFGQSASQSTPSTTAGGFSFSNNTAPSFAFGKNEAPPKTESTPISTPVFSFGKSAPANNSSSSTFNTAPKETTNIFETTAPKPAVNGGFNFGSAASGSNAQKTGFNFGAPSTGFVFGANSTSGGASTATGGFSFGASSQTAQPPVFDANAKPSFNFSGGASLPSFSAEASGAGAPAQQRKIRRAVRRNAQR